MIAGKCSNGRLASPRRAPSGLDVGRGGALASASAGHARTGPCRRDRSGWFALEGRVKRRFGRIAAGGGDPSSWRVVRNMQGMIFRQIGAPLDIEDRTPTGRGRTGGDPRGCALPTPALKRTSSAAIRAHSGGRRAMRLFHFRKQDSDRRQFVAFSGRYDKGAIHDSKKKTSSAELLVHERCERPRFLRQYFPIPWRSVTPLPADSQRTRWIGRQCRVHAIRPGFTAITAARHHHSRCDLSSLNARRKRRDRYWTQSSKMAVRAGMWRISTIVCVADRALGPAIWSQIR